MPRQDLVALNTRLAEELAAVNSQFANYRLAVEQTLDRRWGDDKQDAPTKSGEASTKDESQYYWESYAANGTWAFCYPYSPLSPFLPSPPN